MTEADLFSAVLIKPIPHMKKVNCFWLGRIYLQIYWYKFNSKLTVLSYHDFLVLLFVSKENQVFWATLSEDSSLLKWMALSPWFLLEMAPQANILESEVMINSLHASSVCGIFGVQAMCCSELKLVLPLLQGEKSFCLFCLNQ